MKKKYVNISQDDEAPIFKLIRETDVGAMELSEYIDERLEHVPLNRKSKEFRKWKSDLNKLIDSYNDKFGKAYRRIK